MFVSAMLAQLMKSVSIGPSSFMSTDDYDRDSKVKYLRLSECTEKDLRRAPTQYIQSPIPRWKSRLGKSPGPGDCARAERDDHRIRTTSL